MAKHYMLWSASVAIWLHLLRCDAFGIVDTATERGKNRNSSHPFRMASDYSNRYRKSDTELRSIRWRLPNIDWHWPNIKPIWKETKNRLTEFFRHRKSEESGANNKKHTSNDQSKSSSFPSEVVAQEASTELSIDSNARWSVAAPDVDLSGVWKPIITTAFRQEYDRYLQHCGEGIIFRKALLAAIGLGKEVYEQRDGGRTLSITGVSPMGKWERVLLASGMDPLAQSPGYEPIFTSFRDPDGDTVQVEAWWESAGTVHTSMLRGKPRVQGGTFESRRYLDPRDSDILICDSIFHPPTGLAKFKQDRVQWRFQRQI